MILTDVVNSIYNIDLDKSIIEFKTEFNNISKLPDPTGIHTFTISSYEDNKVITEVLFCSIYRKTVLMYASQVAVEVIIGNKQNDDLDDVTVEYEITGGTVNPIGGSFIEQLANENKSSAYYIGRHVNNANLEEYVSNLINANLHELNSLVLDTDLRNNIINMSHPDIKLIYSKTVNNVYYDIYTIPSNSTFKIQQVDGIDDIDNINVVDVVIVSSNPDLVYLGDCCNASGFYYRMYTLNKSEELSCVIDIINAETNDVDNLVIDYNELVDISVDFFNERMNMFKTDVNTAIEKEELAVGLDENPYSNRYYDVDKASNQKEPLKMTRRLGEGQ